MTFRITPRVTAAASRSIDDMNYHSTLPWTLDDMLIEQRLHDSVCADGKRLRTNIRKIQLDSKERIKSKYDKYKTTINERKRAQYQKNRQAFAARSVAPDISISAYYVQRLKSIRNGKGEISDLRDVMSSRVPRVALLSTANEYILQQVLCTDPHRNIILVDTSYFDNNARHKLRALKWTTTALFPQLNTLRLELKSTWFITSFTHFL